MSLSPLFPHPPSLLTIKTLVINKPESSAKITTQQTTNVIILLLGDFINNEKDLQLQAHHIPWVLTTPTAPGAENGESGVLWL